jgi:hypothetical protein
MKIRAWVLVVLVGGLCASPASAQFHKEHKTFKNVSAVGANDFTLVTTATGDDEGIQDASIKRGDGTHPFPDTALAGHPPTMTWPTSTHLGADIAVDSIVVVCVELRGKNAHIGDCLFSRGGILIGTDAVKTDVKQETSSSGPIYKVKNPSASENIRLTDVEVRKDGNPASIFITGGYVGGGTLVSSTALVTLAPGDSASFPIGGTIAGKAMSIRFDAARSSAPTIKFYTLSADIAGTGVPIMRWPLLEVCFGALLAAGSLLLLRRRQGAPPG